MRLKGIHLAMRSGMQAAEAAFEAIRANDTSASRLKAFEAKVDGGPIRRELYPVRNVHQAFEHGLLAGLAFSGLSLVTGGWWPRPITSAAGYERMETLADYDRGGGAIPATATGSIKPDRQLTFDKLTNVHYSGTRHDEDQPVHLLVQTDVCHTICTQEYGNPCQRFCPANVYEMIVEEGAGKRLQINASNCVHCKTCDIADPYQVITWVTPEGGGGPQYDGM
jgi:electron-transferring-flavoprotein dehydrogenase